jgi:hypothetical protein
VQENTRHQQQSWQFPEAHENGDLVHAIDPAELQTILGKRQFVPCVSASHIRNSRMPAQE